MIDDGRTPEDTTPELVSAPDERGRDARGRVVPQHMTDRALLIECVVTMRQVADTLDAIQELPMFKAMSAGQNPLLAMMGR